MFEEFGSGDEVQITYVSERSGSEVTRTGTVLQTPADGKRGFFVQTDNDQLTGVLSGRVYSLTVGEADGERGIQRQTYLGEVASVDAV